MKNEAKKWVKHKRERNRYNSDKIAWYLSMWQTFSVRGLKQNINSSLTMPKSLAVLQLFFFCLHNRQTLTQTIEFVYHQRGFQRLYRSAIFMHSNVLNGILVSLYSNSLWSWLLNVCEQKKREEKNRKYWCLCKQASVYVIWMAKLWARIIFELIYWKCFEGCYFNGYPT